MYSKSGSLQDSYEVFEQIPFRDNVSWTSMIAGFAEHGCGKQALSLFRDMVSAGNKPDQNTLTAALGACSVLQSLHKGREIHGYVFRAGLGTESFAGGALVSMYAKCGALAFASKVFDMIDEPDLISWTSLIASYASHGKGEEALQVYDHMIEKGIQPDAVTFVEIISACSHAGLVERGHSCFHSMTRDFGIEPDNRHFACMVDLLGRSGRLKEAERFIDSMPIDPDSLVWTSLLAACKLHGDVELGKVAAEKVMELAPGRSGTYISLSNIFADVGKWKEAVEIRRRMSRIGVIKEPGWSFT
ncbi:unnamed protein product [Linum tenue]|uniref:Pentatricopeptide repeat-containing protein n=1 Tax=Linum tenue TaxID=586396 RepID=A0AAV0IW74_9ROSI|nr:unnamed protein product [Linum tenue]